MQPRPRRPAPASTTMSGRQPFDWANDRFTTPHPQLLQLGIDTTRIRRIGKHDVPMRHDGQGAYCAVSRTWQVVPESKEIDKLEADGRCWLLVSDTEVARLTAVLSLVDWNKKLEWTESDAGVVQVHAKGTVSSLSTFISLKNAEKVIVPMPSLYLSSIFKKVFDNERGEDNEFDYYCTRSWTLQETASAKEAWIVFYKDGRGEETIDEASLKSLRARGLQMLVGPPNGVYYVNVSNGAVTNLNQPAEVDPWSASLLKVLLLVANSFYSLYGGSLSTTTNAMVHLSKMKTKNVIPGVKLDTLAMNQVRFLRAFEQGYTSEKARRKLHSSVVERAKTNLSIYAASTAAEKSWDRVHATYNFFALVQYDENDAEDIRTKLVNYRPNIVQTLHLLRESMLRSGNVYVGTFTNRVPGEGKLWNAAVEAPYGSVEYNAILVADAFAKQEMFYRPTPPSALPRVIFPDGGAGNQFLQIKNAFELPVVRVIRPHVTDLTKTPLWSLWNKKLEINILRLCATFSLEGFLGVGDAGLNPLEISFDWGRRKDGVFVVAYLLTFLNRLRTLFTEFRYRNMAGHFWFSDVLCILADIAIWIASLSVNGPFLLAYCIVRALFALASAAMIYTINATSNFGWVEYTYYYPLWMIIPRFLVLGIMLFALKTGHLVAFLVWDLFSLWLQMMAEARALKMVVCRTLDNLRAETSLFLDPAPDDTEPTSLPSAVEATLELSDGSFLRSPVPATVCCPRLSVIGANGRYFLINPDARLVLCALLARRVGPALRRCHPAAREPEWSARFSKFQKWMLKWPPAAADVAAARRGKRSSHGDDHDGPTIVRRRFRLLVYSWLVLFLLSLILLFISVGLHLGKPYDDGSGAANNGSAAPLEIMDMPFAVNIRVADPLVGVWDRDQVRIYNMSARSLLYSVATDYFGNAFTTNDPILVTDGQAKQRFCLLDGSSTIRCVRTADDVTTYELQQAVLLWTICAGKIVAYGDGGYVNVLPLLNSSAAPVSFRPNSSVGSAMICDEANGFLYTFGLFSITIFDPVTFRPVAAMDLYGFQGKSPTMAFKSALYLAAYGSEGIGLRKIDLSSLVALIPGTNATSASSARQSDTLNATSTSTSPGGTTSDTSAFLSMTTTATTTTSGASTAVGGNSGGSSVTATKTTAATAATAVPTLFGPSTFTDQAATGNFLALVAQGSYLYVLTDTSDILQLVAATLEVRRTVLKSDYQYACAGLAVSGDKVFSICNEKLVVWTLDSF
ncbi:hypothetical protein DFJ73DRAFT_962213 [Zopfochytrium polystomum]|nr:hypothetical protein DFJ73DRAFT_962213 [Zopfochytrium polystomum]